MKGSETADLDRRFSGVGRLYGKQALDRFRLSRVCVVGIGGVGSWAAEALARSAIGEITLVDLDMIAESNVNRQIHALGEQFGRAKVAAMAERILSINPVCHVRAIEDFVSSDNLDEVLGNDYDYIIDAIDHVRTKAAMIAWCHQNTVPLVTAGAAGGKVDPGQIKTGDLAHTVQDPLLAKVRSLLRKEYGFTRDLKKKFGVHAVFSCEPPRAPVENATCVEPQRLDGINCAGFGSSVCITAAFGFFAAGLVFNALASNE